MSKPKKIIVVLLSMTLPALSFAKETAEQKAIAKRYAEDRKVCADESTSSARMQCLRDAKEEYRKALSELRKEPARADQAQACSDCGKVVSVRTGEQQGKGSAVGLIGGGVVGALLGNQIGQGSGRDIATIAGAAGGAYAGHKIEENVKSTKIWKVTVRFENGDEKSYDFDHDPGLMAGDPVKKSGESIVRR